VVSPILFLAIPLGIAFILPLLGKEQHLRTGDPAGANGNTAGGGPSIARVVQALALLFVLAGVTSWLPALMGGASPVEIVTGGWAPPIGINLRFGLIEAILVALAAATALGVSLCRMRRRIGRGERAPTIELLMFIGAVGLIMTRDLFNTFVFLEVAAIATYALAAVGDERRGLEAGFKYMFIGAIGSAFILVGIALLYRLTGTLNIDDMAMRLSGHASPALATALVFLFMGMIVELKVIPTNGPAIDLYDGVDPGVMALVAGTAVNAVLFAFWKMLPLFHGLEWTPIIMAVGGATFLVSNLLAIRQDRVRRMLGYSTSAQLGLIIFLMPLVRNGTVPGVAPVLLVINHTLSKAGLLWLVGAHGGETKDDWRGAFANSPLSRLSMAVLIMAIVGLPPFPGFMGKWQALVALANGPHAWWIVPILIGSLLEFVYYFSWLKRAHEPSVSAVPSPRSWPVSAHVFSVAALLVGLWSLRGIVGSGTNIALIIGGVGLALILLRRLPERLLAVVSLVTILAGGWMLYGTGLLSLDLFSGFFLAIVLVGGAIAALASLGIPVSRRSYHGLFLTLIASLIVLVDSQTLLGFFVGWELMTWTSYLLVAKGRDGARPAYTYMLFSGAAGFLVLGGIMVATGAGAESLSHLTHLTGNTALWTAALLGTGFAIKAASAGTHIWAPGAYTESPDVFTAFISGVLSKMPVFGLIIFGARMATGGELDLFGRVDLTYILAWVGGITAFGMTLLAAFQEDAKKLLAYSSVGQIGYVIVGFAMLTPLGWSAALFHSVNHLLIKLLLFLAIAGVIHRTKTRNMHEMGGLIKRMPASYISVLIGIIALSGVPPLSGFTGKWLLYSALLEKGWYFVAGITMFASVVAFLYLFRLIHTIFLGQLKPEHREVREAPLSVILAQAFLVFAIMGLSMFPDVLLKVITAMISPFFGSEGIRFLEDGSLAVQTGYFNAFLIMSIVMVLFGFFFAFLLFLGPKTKKVKQLDIVYSGELPPPPEEIHYAFDFYRPYKRAFASILVLSATRAWQRFSSRVARAADIGRRFYTGDVQTYLIYAVVSLVVIALVRMWI